MPAHALTLIGVISRSKGSVMVTASEALQPNMSVTVTVAKAPASVSPGAAKPMATLAPDARSMRSHVASMMSLRCDAPLASSGL